MTKKVKKTQKKALTKIEVKEATAETVSPVKKTKIRVVGIGGGGGNIVSELAQKVGKATFVAANTDLQALQQVFRKVERFSFGQSFTRGLGTGMNPEMAEAAGQNEKERIKKILQGQDLVILIACLGGGTGSGAAATFAKISQNLGNLTYGIFTLPFKFEGEKKMEIAKTALENLRPKLNTVTVLPNERIFQVIEKTTPLKEAFSSINKNLTVALEGLIETIYQPGLINIDFADLRTVLEGRGRLAYLNTFSLQKKEGEGAKEAVEKALASPLYPYGIRGAKGVLFNIVGEKGLSLEEVSQISKTISEKANPEAKIIFGISPAGKPQNVIKTTIFATGCAAKIFSDENAKPKKSRRKKNKWPRTKSVEKKSVDVRHLQKSVQKPDVDHRPKPQKRKVKTTQKPEKKVEVLPEAETKKENPPAPETKIEIKVRKNALQVRKETEEEEKEMLEKEKLWETPAFLRSKSFTLLSPQLKLRRKKTT